MGRKQRRVTRREFVKQAAAAGLGLAGLATSAAAREEPAGRDGIAFCRIHPGIGVARVGNSSEEYFIGPELPYPTDNPPGGYRDAAGALKRQAARFRVYGYNAAGQVVRELTAPEAEIQWTVHVANKKAAWYQFEQPMDVPGARPCRRRNARIRGTRREQLVIDPSPRSISGLDQAGPAYRFDTGRFLGEAVYLGELRTDPGGRLLFLGGWGVSGTPLARNAATTFANNDGWFDDIADGPVSAEVTFRGRALPVDPAWVVAAPPNYAPDILSVQTLYDVIEEVYLGRWLRRPARPSFARHILPLLQEFCNTQWVNYGFHVQFGWDAPYDFLRPSFLAKLGSGEAQYAELRRQIFNQFRSPDFARTEVNAWPPIYGDAMESDTQDPRQFMALTRTQHGYLKQWAEGDFEADWEPGTPPVDRAAAPRRIEAVPIADQPATLDRAALQFCMGGPFHPGCEMTWPMRHLSLYAAPFRIRRRDPGQAEPDYGNVLTPAAALRDTGPLAASGPGDITRWMAVPWQTDTASCRSGYDREYDPYLPTFWPARVPNHVLTEEQYRRVLDTSRSLDERLLAFNTRAAWERKLTGSYLQQINQMVRDFGKLGVVERRDGPSGETLFPSVFYVESES
jgi:hypothetical protein